MIYMPTFGRHRQMVLFQGGLQLKVELIYLILNDQTKTLMLCCFGVRQNFVDCRLILSFLYRSVEAKFKKKKVKNIEAEHENQYTGKLALKAHKERNNPAKTKVRAQT